MEDEGLPWSSLKKVSDRFAENGEDMLEVLVNDIDRYEQLSNREELLALASALAGKGVILEAVPLDSVPLVNLEQCDATIQNPEDLLQNNSNEVNDGSFLQDRYKAVTISDTEQFILDNRNANTRTKTKSDLKMFYEWALSNGEMRMVEDIPFPELDGLLERFYLANPTALLNTVWLNNGVHYGFRGRQEHTNLKLGDLKLLKDGSGTEYVEFYASSNRGSSVGRLEKHFTLTHYNIPSIKQQSKASKILSEITIPESSNELDDVNLMNEPEHSFDTVIVNEPEHSFDTVIVNEPEHSFDTEPNDNNTDNLNNKLETFLEKENNPNPIFSQSSSMNSKMISTATRKESNPFSILCGATITGGVINLNIYSGKRKHYELDSSQE
ncbi:unnamed protein product [Mytilus coruscus]|uniref:DUF3504 domain-containing protein n=1 Tax=Mytilus coruscus TaxID=42192 RepID=A0A6J8A8D4_MYTCO|nr:unnamed protein product [Mytilus coruscus]